MNRATKWFIAIVAAQVLFLLGWAGYHEKVRQYAPVILLQGRPVDPRDLLRGDYMTLSYDISNVTIPDLPAGEKQVSAMGATVWVLLEKRGNYHVVAEASLKPLSPAAGQFLVQGTLTGANGFGRAPRVEYGIERFFVPEGKGTPRFKTLEVEASVSPEQRLYIRRVLLDGKSYP